MDVHLLSSRVHSVKHNHSAESSAIFMDDGDEHGDDGVRAWFPCPFCYVEIEIPVFCSHLQQDHCFDLKNGVCPICAATLGRDALGHFLLQHSHSVKRGRISQKSGLWSSSKKDLRELTKFLGTHPKDDESDPLISHFICPLSLYGSNDQHPSANATTLTTDESSSTVSPSSDPVQEHENRARRERAAFLQELIFSTIF